jgi:hypothetical protein
VVGVVDVERSVVEGPVLLPVAQVEEGRNGVGLKTSRDVRLVWTLCCIDQLQKTKRL